MMLSKGIIAVVLLALGVASTLTAVFAPRLQLEKKPESVADLEKPSGRPMTQIAGRPLLKTEWIGRWQSDSFAGTTAIEIDEPGNHRVTDLHKVAAFVTGSCSGILAGSVCRQGTRSFGPMPWVVPFSKR